LVGYEPIVMRSKVNKVLVLTLLVTLAISPILIGYFYIHNTTLESDKTYLQNEISNLESKIPYLQSEILAKYSSGYNTGYDDGYIQGVEDGAGKGYNIRDPTYNEAITFIKSDKTDENKYSKTYTCFHFTADFKKNAFQVGYRCGFVHIEFVDSAHAIVCFNTVDERLIFIEPQTDDVATLIIGCPYWDRTIYEPPSYDDTIVSFTIIW